MSTGKRSSAGNNPFRNSGGSIPASPSSGNLSARSSYQWGENSPELGMRVRVKTKSGDLPGTLRFRGEVQSLEGIWFGVELDEPMGKNNGSIGDVRYFSCPELHGLFCRSPMVWPEDTTLTNPKSETVQVGTPRAMNSTAEPGLASTVEEIKQAVSLAASELEPPGKRPQKNHAAAIAPEHADNVAHAIAELSNAISKLTSSRATDVLADKVTSLSQDVQMLRDQLQDKTPLQNLLVGPVADSIALAVSTTICKQVEQNRTDGQALAGSVEDLTVTVSSLSQNIRMLQDPSYMERVLAAPISSALADTRSLITSFARDLNNLSDDTYVRKVVAGPVADVVAEAVGKQLENRSGGCALDASTAFSGLVQTVDSLSHEFEMLADKVNAVSILASPIPTAMSDMKEMIAVLSSDLHKLHEQPYLQDAIVGPVTDAFFEAIRKHPAPSVPRDPQIFQDHKKGYQLQLNGQKIETTRSDISIGSRQSSLDPGSSVGPSARRQSLDHKKGYQLQLNGQNLENTRSDVSIGSRQSSLDPESSVGPSARRQSLQKHQGEFALQAYSETESHGASSSGTGRSSIRRELSPRVRRVSVLGALYD